MKSKRPSHKERVIQQRLNDENYDERWKSAYIWAEAAKVRKANIDRMRRQTHGTEADARPDGHDEVG